MEVQSPQGPVSKAVGSGAAPDPDVDPKAKRRQFCAAYKARILAEVDPSPGQTGEILRREGLYSSHLTHWRRQRHTGMLKALSKKRGPKGKSEEQCENERQRKENVRLQREFEKAQILIGAKKKLAEIIDVDLPKITASDDDDDE